MDKDWSREEQQQLSEARSAYFAQKEQAHDDNGDSMMMMVNNDSDSDGDIGTTGNNSNSDDASSKAPDDQEDDHSSNSSSVEQLDQQGEEPVYSMEEIPEVDDDDSLPLRKRNYHQCPQTGQTYKQKWLLSLKEHEHEMAQVEANKRELFTLTNQCQILDHQLRKANERITEQYKEKAHASEVWQKKLDKLEEIHK